MLFKKDPKWFPTSIKRKTFYDRNALWLFYSESRTEKEVRKEIENMELSIELKNLKITIKDKGKAVFLSAPNIILILDRVSKPKGQGGPTPGPPPPPIMPESFGLYERELKIFTDRGLDIIDSEINIAPENLVKQ